MLTECAVITGFFVLMSVIFIRAHHKEWALATLPMVIVPVADCVVEFLLISVLKINVNLFGGILTMIVALAVASVWIGVISQTMKEKKTSVTYVSISNFFNIALTAIVVAEMLDKSSVLSSHI